MTSKIVEFLKGSFITRTSGFLDVSSKAGLFREISDVLGGEFTMSHNPGNVLSTLRMVIPYKNREIILTESDTRPLKFQVSFESLRDYELIVGIEDFFDKILKMFDKKEVEVGDEVFDSHYLIHSNDPVLTTALLNKPVRDKILRHNLYTVSYQTDAKRKKSELLSVVSRTINDKEAYLDLVSIHQMLIDNLTEFGIVSNISV